MTPFLSRSLCEEVSAITPDDGRAPLPLARPRAVSSTISAAEIERRIFAELLRVGPLETGQVAARLLQREPDVARALLKLALAMRVVRCRGRNGVGVWRAVPMSSEESV